MAQGAARHRRLRARRGAVRRAATEGMHRAPQVRWRRRTNPRQVPRLPREEVLKGADVFIGVSSGNLLEPCGSWRPWRTVPSSSRMADPVPEVDPIRAAGTYAAVVATGRAATSPTRSTRCAWPFPGLFRGLLDTKVSRRSTTEAAAGRRRGYRAR